MAENDYFDFVVVGAGVIGCSTAYYLAKNGHKTLLLEKFPLNHSRGSSHGMSRITRKAYDTPIYTEMMLEGYRMWEQLALDSNIDIFKKTGLVYLSQKFDGSVQNQAENMRKWDLPHGLMSSEQATKRWPVFAFGPEFTCLYDSDAGVLKANKCLLALQKQFVKYGGVIYDCEPVQNVIPVGDTVKIRTNNCVYNTKNLVLCLGPWCGPFLKSLHLNLPLQPEVVKVFYWKLKAAYSNNESLPCIICHDETAQVFCYGLPNLEYPELFKFCLHDGVKTEAESRDAVFTGDILPKLKEYVKLHLPGVEPEPKITETCIYTNTPDSHFILDRHPMFQNIVIGAGFSGHGFKLGPVVGKLLAELALKEENSYQMELFRVNRFDNTQYNGSRL